MKYTKEFLETLSLESSSVSDMVRKLGLKPSGGQSQYLGKKLKQFEIDISHFNKGSHHKGRKRKWTWQEVLIKKEVVSRISTKILRTAMLESLIAHQCSECKLGPSWNNKSLCLQIDHINGDGTDNSRENLRFLCPNCHSQTENHGARNIKIKPKKSLCKECLTAEATRHSRLGLCKECSSKKRSQTCMKGVKKPSKEDLEREVNEFTWQNLGKKYGVSGNTIKRWVIEYNISHSPKPIKPPWGKRVS